MKNEDAVNEEIIRLNKITKDRSSSVQLHNEAYEIARALEWVLSDDRNGRPSTMLTARVMVKNILGR